MPQPELAPSSVDDGRQPSPLRSFRWHSSESVTGLSRRPTDVLLLLSGVFGLLLLAPLAPGPTAADLSLVELAEALPGAVAWLFQAAYALASGWAVVLLLVSLLSRRHRVVALHLLLAAGLALAAAVVAGAVEGTALGESWRALWSSDPALVYLAVRVAVVTAVVSTASPHVARPVRLVGWLLLTVLVAASVVVGTAYPIGAVAGFFTGIAAAACVHLALGSPGGRLTARAVAEAMADLGLTGGRVTDVPDVFGASTFRAELPDRAPLLVTVLGRDEWDAQAVGSMWTAATRRGERLSVGTTRLGRVEHAALVGLLAERAGVRVLPVVAAGRSADGDALLVTEAPSQQLADLSASEVTDAVLDSAWRQLARLHAAGIAHRLVDGEHLVLDRHQQVALAGLDGALLGAPPSELVIDRARLLVTTFLLTDVDRAVASALRVLGPAELSQVLAYVQPAVLNRQDRARLREGEGELAALRSAVEAATGTAAPPLEEVRRVTPGALLRVGLGGLLAYGLVSAFSGVDLAAVWSELATAQWAWLAAALVVSPAAQVPFAVATLGTTTARLRYWPVLMLQYAVQFLALALPSTAARIALDVRFFQSFGITAGPAVTMGMIDGFSGFVVQVLLLLVILLSELPGLTVPLGQAMTSGTSEPDSSSPSLLVLSLVLGLVSVIVVVVTPSLRRRFVGWSRRLLTELRVQARASRSTLAVLRRPGRVAMLLGGNLGGQLVQAVVLGLCLAAFGEDASLSQLILVNTAVSLFAGLMPVPGGIGVAEAGYTLGLTAIGVPSAVAVSTAIAFRVVTFYLPPLWGAVAMRWLRRHSYV